MTVLDLPDELAFVHAIVYAALGSEAWTVQMGHAEGHYRLDWVEYRRSTPEGRAEYVTLRQPEFTREVTLRVLPREHLAPDVWATVRRLRPALLDRVWWPGEL